MKTFQHFIGGQFLASVDSKTLDVINPATGTTYAHLCAGSEADVNKAVIAAQDAAYVWGRTSLMERQRILQAIADGILVRLEEFAQAEVLDTGRPISQARELDIPRAASNFSFFAAAASQLSSESHETPGRAINYTLRQPIGVVGCISPWNLPLYLYTWKIAPALAAGNVVVSKPSELSPATAHLLGEVCIASGLPAGVLNIIHGTGPDVGEAIVRHHHVKAISFTGSTAVGKRIAGICAEQLKKVSLELGGKNPVIIFADCDYDEMLATTIRSSFSNTGQICLCGSRILVQRSIYKKFVEDFVAKTKALRIGDPFQEETQIGALISEGHMNKVLSYIELAQMEGGKIECGGRRIEQKGGYYIEPTVITGLVQQCRTNQEEIFGPVVTIEPFDTELDALNLANQSVYGLAAVVWTNHLARSQRMASLLHAGIIWINTWLMRDLRTPFGGMKQSGVGREGGWEAIRFFTEAKNVTIAFEQ